jgi:CRISPR type III-B/RAMP module RAMP protein Cmr6
VYFLVIESGVEFRFPILAQSNSDADTIERVLELGLDWLGIGAKTAVGYGRLTKLDSSVEAPAA